MENNFTKDFDSWNEVKKKIENKASAKHPNYREIWWCSIGSNVGVEICGKGNNFCRPVLVLRSFGHEGFIGIPLTSELKTGFWCISFIFYNKYSCAIVNQARFYSTKRLQTRIGLAPKDVFSEINMKFSQISS